MPRNIARRRNRLPHPLHLVIPHLAMRAGSGIAALVATSANLAAKHGTAGPILAEENPFFGYGCCDYVHAPRLCGEGSRAGRQPVAGWLRDYRVPRAR